MKHDLRRSVIHLQYQLEHLCSYMTGENSEDSLEYVFNVDWIIYGAVCGISECFLFEITDGYG